MNLFTIPYRDHVLQPEDVMFFLECFNTMIQASTLRCTHTHLYRYLLLSFGLFFW